MNRKGEWSQDQRDEEWRRGYNKAKEDIENGTFVKWTGSTAAFEQGYRDGQEDFRYGS